MKIDALKELAEKVEAGEYDAHPDRFNEFARDWESAFGTYFRPTYNVGWSAYKGSLDAAKALHDAVLPGLRWEGGSGGLFAVWDDPAEPHKGRSDIPARAWLLAILRALIAENSQ